MKALIDLLTSIPTVGVSLAPRPRIYVFCKIPRISSVFLPSHPCPSLDSLSILEQRWQLALLSLEVRVAADVLLANEDIRDRALASHFFKRILDLGAVVYEAELSGPHPLCRAVLIVYVPTWSSSMM